MILHAFKVLYYCVIKGSRLWRLRSLKICCLQDGGPRNLVVQFQFKSKGLKSRETNGESPMEKQPTFLWHNAYVLPQNSETEVRDTCKIHSAHMRIQPRSTRESMTQEANLDQCDQESILPDL